MTDDVYDLDQARQRLRQKGEDHPAYGHLFHFSVSVQGIDEDWDGDPYTLTVRAWNLSEACRRAAAEPLSVWYSPTRRSGLTGTLLTVLDDLGLMRLADRLRREL